MLVFQRNTLYVVILTCHGNVCERDEVRDGHHLQVALKICNIFCKIYAGQDGDAARDRANSRVDRHNTRLIYAESTAQHPTTKSSLATHWRFCIE